ncbi:MAG TPA: SAM-dependent methyltransferase [Nannocystis sp.]
MRSLLLLTALAACRPSAAPEPAAPASPAASPVPSDSPAAAPAGASIAEILADPARPEEERALDAGRKPAELLAFLDLRPGMKAADIGAGHGYTTFLLARSVAPDGRVYAQNPRFARERFTEPGFTERMKTPAFANVVRVDQEFDAPIPADVRDLDLVINFLFYHDTYWMKVDNAAMNRAIFAALRPGGAYVIVDHSAAPGTGTSASQTLHRVEESVVRAEVEAAGFRLAASADFLRNPADPRDWNAMPTAAAKAGRRGQADRFVLKFVKP